MEKGLAEGHGSRPGPGVAVDVTGLWAHPEGAVKCVGPGAWKEAVWTFGLTAVVRIWDTSGLGQTLLV